MPAYSKAKIKRLLKKSDTAPTDDAKGDAFEELFCYLFGKIPGITSCTSPRRADVTSL